MHTLRRFLTVSSVLLAIGVLSAAAANAATNGTDRPLTGYSTSFNNIDLGSGVATSDGVSWLSHCGYAKFHNDMIFSFTGPDSFQLVGTDTETCANGDKIFSDFVITGTVSTGKS